VASEPFISWTDFPSEAVGRTGSVAYEVDVSTGGWPTQCRVIESSRVEVLDRRTCELAMARQRFLPAVDGAGQPRAGSYRGHVTWRGG
jgi:TonB family protein